MEDRTCSVEGCDKPSRVKGLCGTHRNRWLKGILGGPIKQQGHIKAQLVAASAAESDECIDLIHNQKGPSRPTVTVGGVRTNASRAVWILAHGDPGPLHVLHSCHNHECINIQHLYLGDHQRNMQDMVESGRDRRPSGDASPNSKLSNEQAAEIRKRYAAGGITYVQLAAQYGLSEKGIWKILAGRTYGDGRPVSPKRPDYGATPEQLAEVAAIYRENLAGTPVMAVAKKFGLPRGTAARRVRQARAEGLLPPTWPGRRSA